MSTPAPKKRSSVHSLRTPDDLWKKAEKRAKEEGVTMNYALNEFIEGYSLGFINLPKVTKTYNPAE